MESVREGYDFKGIVFNPETSERASLSGRNVQLQCRPTGLGRLVRRAWYWSREADFTLDLNTHILSELGVPIAITPDSRRSEIINKNPAEVFFTTKNYKSLKVVIDGCGYKISTDPYATRNHKYYPLVIIPLTQSTEGMESEKVTGSSLRNISARSVASCGFKTLTVAAIFAAADFVIACKSHMLLSFVATKIPSLAGWAYTLQTKLILGSLAKGLFWGVMLNPWVFGTALVVTLIVVGVALLIALLISRCKSEKEKVETEYVEIEEKKEMYVRLLMHNVRKNGGINYLQLAREHRRLDKIDDDLEDEDLCSFEV